MDAESPGNVDQTSVSQDLCENPWHHEKRTVEEVKGGLMLGSGLVICGVVDEKTLSHDHSAGP